MTKKNACFLLQYFLENFTCLFHHKLLILFLLQINLSLKKKEKKGKKNPNIVLLVIIKMVKIQLHHFPLGFSIIQKPDQFYYCNISNCLFFLSINIDDPIKVLTYNHTYYKFYYNNIGFKYLHCLSFLCNSIDEHI